MGVAEVLTLEDLNLPVLFDERADTDSIVLVRGTVDEREYGCALRRGEILLWSVAMIFYRGTNMDDNFPWCFNHFMNSNLEAWLSVCKLEGGSPDSDVGDLPHIC